jgi:coenzyme F420-reducing hydrogenase delta subunit
VIEETWEILRLLGVDEQRLQLKWISASEGAAFAEEIHSFVQILKALGENPFKGSVDELSDIRHMVGNR